VNAKKSSSGMSVPRLLQTNKKSNQEALKMIRSNLTQKRNKTASIAP